MSVGLITGGGGGIGRAIALQLARDGMSVAVADQQLEAAQEAAQLVTKAGGKAIALGCNVSDAADVANMVSTTEERLGPIAAFANNAGIEGVLAPIYEYPDATFDQVLGVNVKGVFLCLKYVLARMRVHGAGAVVITGSTSSIRGRAGLAGYVASKHAILGLMRVAALDMAGTHVRVNAVLPGPIETRMIRSLDAQARAQGIQVARSGNAHYGQPEDVAAVVAFLLSDSARHVNGAAWSVDAAISVR